MANDPMTKQSTRTEETQQTEDVSSANQPKIDVTTEEAVNANHDEAVDAQESPGASNEKVATKKQSFFARLTKIDEIQKVKTVQKPIFDSNKDGYVSAREAINALDGETRIESLTDEEKIAQEVGYQLEKQVEYLVFRVRKSTVLLFGGIVVLLLWLVPLTMVMGQKYGFETIFSDYAIRIWPQTTPIPSSTPQPSPQVIIERIRIKGFEDDERVGRIESLLQAAGFVVEVEVAELADKGVTLAAKQGSDLVNVLSRLLGEEFDATASSVILTDDSDFSAVVMVGKAD